MAAPLGFRLYGQAAFRATPSSVFRGQLTTIIVVTPVTSVDFSLPDLELKVVQRSGALVAELVNAKVDEVEWELCKEGKLDFTLPRTDPVNSLIQCGLHEIQLWRGGFPLFTGPIWQRKRTANGDRSYGCQGLLSYFKKRYVLFASIVYTSIEQTTIANNLVLAAQTGEANMDLLIQTAASVGGSAHIRSRKYDRNKHALFYDLIQEFPGIRDGFDFEIEVDPTGTQRAFTAYYPQKGSQLANIGLVWGRNLVDYEVSDDAFVMATKVYATGGTNAGVKFENNYEDAAQSAVYGVMEMIVSDSQQKDVTELQDLAKRNVEIRKVPAVVTKVTAVENLQPLIGFIKTGDSARVEIDDYDVQVSGYQRIQKIKWTPSDGKIAYDFTEPVILT